MRQISILGAGPAGLTAAINLAKEGYKVTIFEKRKLIPYVLTRLHSLLSMLKSLHVAGRLRVVGLKYLSIKRKLINRDSHVNPEQIGV